MTCGDTPPVLTERPAKQRNGIVRKLRRFPKTLLCCFMSAVPTAHSFVLCYSAFGLFPITNATTAKAAQIKHQDAQIYKSEKLPASMKPSKAPIP